MTRYLGLHCMYLIQGLCLGQYFIASKNKKHMFIEENNDEDKMEDCTLFLSFFFRNPLITVEN